LFGWSVTVEVFTANIVAIDAGVVQHTPHRLDHRWRPGDVPDRRRPFFCDPSQQRLVDLAARAMPWPIGRVRLRHRGHQPEVRVLSLELLQFAKMLVAARGDQISITATDLEVELVAKISVSIQQGGENAASSGRRLE
jgi:hypothetical protein